MLYTSYYVLTNLRLLRAHVCMHACSDVLGEYYSEMKKLSARIMQLILTTSLGISDTECTNIAEDKLTACPDQESTVGLAVHTDQSIILTVF